jgi:hypothetical protein
MKEIKPMGGVSEYLDEAELASGRGRQRVFGINRADLLPVGMFLITGY